ncbi:MAG: hypothetical protein F6J95_011250 [Leptolyngbya sp. SIO1E4]|nr:hypothetical protein [Leptolyngbya sp. SIO1E4]
MQIRKPLFFIICVIACAIAVAIGFSSRAQHTTLQPTASVTINSSNPITENLIGLGYNSPFLGTVYSSETLTERMDRAITESNKNGYFRVMFGLRNFAPERETRTPNSRAMVNLYKHLDILKKNNITVHFTFTYRESAIPDWLGGGQALLEDETRRLLASTMAEMLDHLITVKGYDNIKYWSPTNEMAASVENPSQHRFAVFYHGPNVEGPSRADEYQAAYLSLVEAIKEALASRSLADKLTMGVPELGKYWPLWWAKRNFRDTPNVMFDIHHYIEMNKPWQAGNPNDPVTYPANTAESYRDPELYERLLFKYSTFAEMVKDTGKPIVAGEFGPGRAAREGNAQRYVDLGSGQYGLMVAEQAIALLNAGFSGLAKWSIADLIGENTRYDYYHGTLALEENLNPRSDYFSYGLLTKTITHGASILQSQSSDPNIHTLAAQNQNNQKVVVVINRTSEEQAVEVIWPDLEGQEASIFAYHPEDQVSSDYDLAPADEMSRQGNRNYVVSLKPQQMIVLTSA